MVGVADVMGCIRYSGIACVRACTRVCWCRRIFTYIYIYVDL